LPSPPPPPSRDRRNQERSPPAGGRRDPLPWESHPPPSTWDGPASGGRRNEYSSWSSGTRHAGDREAGTRNQYEASENWQQGERERSSSRGARRRYRR
jgi:hypothetical protein